MRVTIVQNILPHYRLALFDRLYTSLGKKNVDLKVVYGQEYPGTVPRTVESDATWAIRIDNHHFNLLGTKLVWQPALSLLRGSNIVIVEQANSLLLNHVLQADKWFRRFKLAYWGHGRNMQSADIRSVSELLKKSIIKKVDWWFAYTDISKKIVVDAGFPEDRISILQNTYDTSGLVSTMAHITEAELSQLRMEHGISGESVLLYCGGMSESKRIEFLIQACQKIRNNVPDLEVIFIGDGPDAYKVQFAADKHSWIHYLGAIYGTERAPYFRMCKGLLMPGAVGLAIIDSFVAGAPLFTTAGASHGPEVAYLENGVNGFMTKGGGMDEYVACVSGYLTDGDLQLRVRASCEESAHKYTLTNMVDNFSRGIVSCLGIDGAAL